MDNEVKKPMASSLVDIVLSLEASVLKLVVSRAEEGKQPREILSEILGYLNSKLCLLETNNSEFHRLDFVEKLKRRISSVLNERRRKSVVCKREDGDELSTFENIKKEFRDEVDLSLIEEHVLADLTVAIDSITEEAQKVDVPRAVPTKAHQVESSSVHDQGNLTWDSLLSSFNSPKENVHTSSIEKQRTKKKKKKSSILFQAYSDNESRTSDSGSQSSESSRFSFSCLPAYDTIPQISKDMSTSNSLDTRRRAWDSLNEFAPGDLLHTQFWPMLKDGILCGLADPDSTLESNYVNLIQKLYKEAPPVFTGEVYLCLLSHLTNVTREMFPLKIVSASSKIDRLDFQGSDLNSVMTKLQILNKWQIDIPKHWLYYPDDLNDRIVVGTLNLLRLLKKPNEVPVEEPFLGIEISVFDLLALIDPSAEWFLVWIGRSKMREQLINFMWQTGLLQELVWRVCFFAPTKDHHQYGNNTPLPEKHSWKSLRDVVDEETKSGVVRIGHVRAFRLLHSLAIIGRILAYAQGRRIFEDPRGASLDPSGLPPPKPISIVLPESIETTAIRKVNNLITVVTHGAAWCNVTKEEAEKKNPDKSSDLFTVTIGWWNELETASYVQSASRVTLPQIITTFIDYMVYASNAVQLYAPTIEFLYLSQWQLLLDTLEDVFRDIAIKPEVFTCKQLHMLAYVFVQTNGWTAVGETISKILILLLKNTNGLMLCQAPWSHNIQDSSADSKATLNLLLSYFCSQLPHLHKSKKRYQIMIVRLLEAFSLLFENSHAIARIFQNHTALAEILVQASLNCNTKVTVRESAPSTIEDKLNKEEMRAMSSEADAYDVKVALCNCVARMALSPFGLLMVLRCYKKYPQNQLFNSFEVIAHYVNANLGKNLPTYYDDRLILGEHVMSTACIPCGCEEFEKYGTVKGLHDELVKLLNDPNGVISTPLKLHRPPDEQPYFHALLRLIKNLVSSPHLQTIENRRNVVELQDFIIYNLLLQDAQENTLFFDWHLVGIDLVYSMLCNLNNVVQLENKYSLTDKILALKEQSRVSSDDCLKELPEGVSFVKTTPIRPGITVDNSGANGKQKTYVVDAHSIGHQDLLVSLKHIGGACDRGMYFLPRTRHRTSPHRVPPKLDDIFDLNIEDPADTKRSQPIDIFSNGVVIDLKGDKRKIFAHCCVANDSLREVLDCKAPFKQFCKERASEFWSRGGMWRDWIGRTKTGCATYVGSDYLGSNGKRQVLKQMINTSNAANQSLTHFFYRLMIGFFEKNEEDNQSFRNICNAKKMSLERPCLAYASSLAVDYGKRCTILDKNDASPKLEKTFADVLDNTSSVSIDWFSIVIQLLCTSCCKRDDKTDAITSIEMLAKISKIPSSVFVWPSLANLRCKATNEISPLLTVSHLVTFILEEENPEILAVIKINGLSLNAILSTWISQCFLNFLEWTDILQYIYVSLFLRMDYQVYFVVVLFENLSQSIKGHAWRFMMTEILLQNPLYTTFDIVSSYPRMQCLQEKYGDFVVAEMSKIVNE